MTAYQLIPIGPSGPVMSRAQTVFGHDLSARADLARLVEELLAETERNRAAGAGAQRLKERLDAECALRVRLQSRLARAATQLKVIARECPEAAASVVRARKEIWGSDDA